MKYLGFWLVKIGNRLVCFGSRLMGFNNKIEVHYGMTYIGYDERQEGNRQDRQRCGSRSVRRYVTVRVPFLASVPHWRL